MPPENQTPPTARIRTWKLSNALALVLGALGAVGIIELRPQISVSQQAPIEKAQPFSVPFAINNQGYFSFWLEHAFCYYHKVEVGPITFGHGTDHAPDWNHQTIERGTPKTIMCMLENYPATPKSADMVVVIDYKPFRWFPHTFRRYYRFVGSYIDNWQWLAQPSKPVEADADRAIEEHMKQIPSSR